MENFIHSRGRNKRFVVKKVAPEDPLRKKILEMDNPNTFFENDDQLLIGKAVKKPKFDKNHRIIPHTIVGPQTLFEIAPNMTKNLSKTGSKIYNYLLGKANREEKPKPTVQLINNVEINRIYDSIDSRIRKTNVNDFLTSIPKEVKERLNFQEQCLKRKEIVIASNEKITNTLCQKTNKKKEDLLMNKSPEIRLKNEIKQIVDHKQSLDQFGRNYWVLSLRKDRNRNSESHMTSYVNIGSDHRPVWTMVNENFKKSVEVVRSPFDKQTLPIIDKATRTKYYACTKDKFGVDPHNFDEISSLKLEGHKLLEEEIRMVHKMKGKKFLHRKEDETHDIENYESYPFHTVNHSKNQSTTDTSYFNYSIINN